MYARWTNSDGESKQNVFQIGPSFRLFSNVNPAGSIFVAILAFGATALHSLIPHTSDSTSMPIAQSELENQADCQFFKIDSGEPLIRNLDGEIIKETNQGSQVVLEVSAKGMCDIKRHPMVFLFEVRDWSGLAQFLSWQNTTISSDQTFTVQSSWIAGEPGEYQLRYIALTREMLLSPQPISLVHTYNFKVV